MLTDERTMKQTNRCTWRFGPYFHLNSVFEMPSWSPWREPGWGNTSVPAHFTPAHTDAKQNKRTVEHGTSPAADPVINQWGMIYTKQAECHFGERRRKQDDLDKMRRKQNGSGAGGWGETDPVGHVGWSLEARCWAGRDQHIIDVSISSRLLGTSDVWNADGCWYCYSSRSTLLQLRWPFPGSDVSAAVAEAVLLQASVVQDGEMDWRSNHLWIRPQLHLQTASLSWPGPETPVMDPGVFGW